MSPQVYGKNKLLYWASDIEADTLEQAARTSRLPFVTGHVALMPDAHVGFGSTVGSVIPTKGAIIPGAVGVDIGCGMIATKTAYTAAELPDDLGALMPLVARDIPAGVGKGHDLGYKDGYRTTIGTLMRQLHTRLDPKQEQTAIAQFGTLGSGNHFAEVSLDEDGNVWTVLHSGSRGIGNQLASMHIGRAKGLMKQYFITIEDPDLAYLSEGTPEFDAYIADMLWAQEYAMGNRDRMNDVLLECLVTVLGLKDWMHHYRDAATQVINCHHNYTEKEHHNGQDVWLTRKGAIRARRGDWGVIPGSMGTDSYIVRGKGNPASYCSSSHGAGRRLSRGRAKRELSVVTFREQMAGRAWQASNAAELIDEAPAAYKNIEQVMADQADLTEVIYKLTQVFNYKGTC